MLESHGIRHAALFGSVARDEADARSDVDVLIEIDPGLRLDVFTYVGLERTVGALFDGPVDVVDRETIKPMIRDDVVRDSIYAF